MHDEFQVLAAAAGGGFGAAAGAGADGGLASVGGLVAPQALARGAGFFIGRV